MEDVIQVKDAVKKFGKKKVLDGVSLNVRKGSICGIVGRNGSGKTVLFKTICGFYTLTSGEIFINGRRVNGETDVPDGIGSIIEMPGFLGGFSGYRNLKYLADIRGLIGKKEICAAMERVGLNPKSRKLVGKYSLGMRQRLGIAQAFMEGQEILVLDEPMNGLDNQGVRDMRELMLELKSGGKTILMASHSKEDIETLCDDVYEMDAGTLRRR